MTLEKFAILSWTASPEPAVMKPRTRETEGLDATRRGTATDWELLQIRKRSANRPSALTRLGEGGAGASLYEFHGWCNLRWFAGEVDEDAQELRSIEIVVCDTTTLRANPAIERISPRYS